MTFFLVAAVYFAVRPQAPWMGLSLGLALATKATALPVCSAANPGGVAMDWEAVESVRAAYGGMDCPWRAGDQRAAIRAQLAAQREPAWDTIRRRATASFAGATSTPAGAPRFRMRSATLPSSLAGAAGAGTRRYSAPCLRIHRSLGLDPQDPDTTFRWSRFAPPRNANHEADANNRWHLLLLLIALAAAVGMRATGAGYCTGRRWRPPSCSSASI